jgi:glycerol-3-phosphate acyltransferase PlsY
VGLAWFWVGIDGWGIVPIALAPVVGHAFSPWLKFRGGKALSTTFGIWMGLTAYLGPTVLGLLMAVMYALFATSGWAVMFSMLIFGGIIAGIYWQAQPEFLAVWLVNFLLLLYKHRIELLQPPTLRLRWKKPHHTDSQAIPSAAKKKP